MELSDKGAEDLKGSEGFRSQPYPDGEGVPTIGFGSTVYENGKKVTLKDAPITKERALQLFKITLKQYTSAVDKSVTVPLTQNEFDALVELTYNIGGPAFQKSTLLRLLNAGAPRDQVAAQFLRWNKDNGKVVEGLTNRRKRESNKFLGLTK
jgi:lysozyme